MTKTEFIAEAVLFPLGAMIFMSGKDVAEVTSLLEDALDAIETITTKSALVFNSRDTVVFPARYFFSGDAPSVMTPISEDAMRLREADTVNAQDSFVVMIANQFDRDDPAQNPQQRNINIDTALDLFRARQVSDIPFGFHRKFGDTREVFPFVSKLYFFDTDSDEITFVKDQNPLRP